MRFQSVGEAIRHCLYYGGWMLIGGLLGGPDHWFLGANMGSVIGWVLEEFRGR